MIDDDRFWHQPAQIQCRADFRYVPGIERGIENSTYRVGLSGFL